MERARNARRAGLLASAVLLCIAPRLTALSIVDALAVLGVGNGVVATNNRVRGLFYPGEPPVSTVVEVSRFLPGDKLLVEVEATMYLPR